MMLSVKWFGVPGIAGDCGYRIYQTGDRMEQVQHDADWHDRMYNNRALVPQSAAHIARWAQQSARTRSHHACTLDVAYGSFPTETLDIFAPDARMPATSAPVLVFIHGGYWRALDKADHSFVAPAFTAAGCVVVVVNYALCPGTPEAPVSIALIGEQMERALQWVWEHIAEYGGNPARITVAGHSAGGQLAAALLATPWQVRSPRLPSDVVRSALSISGLHDLQPLMRSPLLQSVLNISADEAQRCSPCRLPPPSQGTLVCAVGGDESAEFLRQNLLMQQAWGSKRVPCAIALSGLNHFSVLETLATPGAPLHAMALDLLRQEG